MLGLKNAPMDDEQRSRLNLESLTAETRIRACCENLEGGVAVVWLHSRTQGRPN